MPDLQSELKKVGLKPNSNLLRERIWNWLKDHPEKPTRHIADSLREHKPYVSRVLFDMRRRGMVTYMVGRHRKFEWSVVARRGAVYELLPMPEPDKVKAASPKKVKAVVPETYVVSVDAYESPVSTPLAVSCTKTTAEQASELVEGMKVDLAHAVYLKLKTYFGQVV